MTTASLDNLRARLASDRDRILSEIEQEQERRQALARTTDGDRYGNHPGDEGTDTFDKESSLAMQSNLELMLAQIDHALQRFDEGSYGKCENCGQTIPIERLEIRPQATLCITCKARDEHAAQTAQAAARNGRPSEQRVY